EVARRRADGIWPEEEIQLGVQGMPQEEVDDDFFRLDLSRQPAQARFIFIGRHAEHELLTEVLGKLLLQAQRGLIVQAVLGTEDGEGISEVFLRQALHTDQQSARMAGASGPPLDMFVDLLPAA